MKQVRKYIQRAEEKRLSSTHFIMFNFTWIYEFQLRISYTIMNFEFLRWDICDEWTRDRVGIRQAKESPRGKGREMTHPFGTTVECLSPRRGTSVCILK